MGTSDNGTLVTLDACYGEGRHVVGSRDVTWDDLKDSDLMSGWSGITVNATVNSPEAVLELRGLRTSGGCELYLGHILVEQRVDESN
jgi:hypothetical protein